MGFQWSLIFSKFFLFIFFFFLQFWVYDHHQYIRRLNFDSCLLGCVCVCVCVWDHILCVLSVSNLIMRLNFIHKVLRAKKSNTLRIFCNLVKTAHYSEIFTWAILSLIKAIFYQFGIEWHFYGVSICTEY